MTIIDAIKKGLKAAGVNEKYAAKVQKLFKIEKEEDIDTYVALFKDNILPDLEDTSAVEKARKDAIAEYEKNNGLKDGKPIKPVKKTKKTAKSEEDDEDEDEDEDFEGLPASVVKLLKAQQKQISELTASVSTVASTLTTSTKQRPPEHCLQKRSFLINGSIVLMSILKLLSKNRLKGCKKNTLKSGSR